MTRYDFSPFYRTSVGFDRLSRILDSMGTVEDAANGFPPYNIEKTDDNGYRITLAVAGFDMDDLSVETRENQLVVTGEHHAVDDEPKDENDRPNYLHRGIARRAFRRSFHLADYVKVLGAHIENGLLHIDLVREVPEEMKPRRIEISTSAPAKLVSKAKKLVEKVKDAA